MDEIALILLHQLPRVPGNEPYVFLCDGKNLICPTRKTTSAIRKLLEAVYPDKKLGDHHYKIPLSEQEIKSRAAFDEKAAGKLFRAIIDKLPRVQSEIWSDGNYILCRSEEVANIIADLLDQVGGNGQISVTGVFDAFEDIANNCVDSLTGYHYVDIA